MSLKPDLFEGMRFDFTKMLNQKFSLNHRYLYVFFLFFYFMKFNCLKFVCLLICCCLISVLMGPTEVPSQSTETIKIPTAHYEFGSTFIDHPRVTWTSFKCPFSLCVCVFFFIYIYIACVVNDAAAALQLLLWGRILTDGRLNARVKCDLSENLTFKANAQVCICVPIMSNVA